MERISRARERGLVVLRVALGFGFLYAGLEKWLNFAGDERPWSAGGFLQFATAGTVPNMVGHAETMIHNPTRQLWVEVAGNTGLIGLVDFLVVFGEIAIGVALILGVATRLAGTLGAIMTFLFWVAAWDFQYGIVNQQFVYMILSAFLAYASAGTVLGLDARIEASKFIQRRPGLRLILG